MELTIILGVLFAIALAASGFLWLQHVRAREEASKAVGDIDGVRTRLTELEAETRKSSEALDAKRRESDELKERLKDVKKRRHEEKESARLKRDIDVARQEIEREMEKKLAVAREEAELSKSQVKKLSNEIDALKSRRSAPVAESHVEAPKHEPRPPPEPRAATPEEVKRAEEAEKAAAQARRKVDEAREEGKKVRARAETDRRVFLVQKGEVDVAKDKFRALEAKYNGAVLERDELKKGLWLLEKELKSLRPTPEAGNKPEAAKAARAEAPRPAEANKPEEPKPEPAAAPVPAEPKKAEEPKPEPVAKA